MKQCVVITALTLSLIAEANSFLGIYPGSTYYQTSGKYHHRTRYFQPLYRPTVPSPVYTISSSPVIARVDLVEGKRGSGVSGVLMLKQKYPGGPVIISGRIHGLSEGLHGFHVHMDGELTNECKDAGGHFNPFMNTHGNPESLDRHVGDLGNIMTFSSNHPTDVLIYDKLITLEEDKENSILGRAIVVHAGQDDLGLGGDEESLKTGNAGARVACGTIHELRLPY